MVRLPEQFSNAVALGSRSGDILIICLTLMENYILTIFSQQDENNEDQRKTNNFITTTLSTINTGSFLLLSQSGSSLEAVEPHP